MLASNAHDKTFGNVAGSGYTEQLIQPVTQAMRVFASCIAASQSPIAEVCLSTSVHCNLGTAALQLAIQIVFYQLKKLDDARVNVDTAVNDLQAQLCIQLQLLGALNKRRQALHLDNQDNKAANSSCTCGNCRTTALLPCLAEVHTHPSA